MLYMSAAIILFSLSLLHLVTPEQLNTQPPTSLIGEVCRPFEGQARHETFAGTWVVGQEEEVPLQPGWAEFGRVWLGPLGATVRSSAACEFAKC
jgi:hypothetical protein